MIAIHNPATGDVISSIPVADNDSIAAAIDVAQRGRASMAALPAHARAALLTATADGIVARFEELARLLAAENGKPIEQTRGELTAATNIFRGFAEEAKRLFGRQIPLDASPGLERHLAVTIREPIGVVAAIVPFNYPVELYAYKAAAALAAGNAVIVKPPEKCPLTLVEIAGIVAAAGAPSGAHQLLNGGPEVARKLVESPGVQMVSLTGSAAAGREVAAIAARTLKKVQLELGGNDPMIVCADADLDRAAEAVVLGRLARGNGQICCAVKRIYVEDAVYDDFAANVVERAGKLRVGDPLDEATEVGPLITETAAREVESAIRRAVAGGATLAVGGSRDGNFVQPTVLTNVRPDEPELAKEIFGPVAPLVRVRDAEEALTHANTSDFGLQAAVFTRDVNRAFSIARRLEAGGVIVNGSTAMRSERLPFGGSKNTGGSRESLHDTLKTLDFGGKRDGSIFYDGRENGYGTEGCRTQHPWPEGIGTPGWDSDPTAPYCEWQSVRNGQFGYNGFHFMSIVDFANPAPRNNHFWHYRRKVLMDSFAQHPDRVGSGSGGRICDASTGQYYNYRDSNFNTVNMWISGMPNYTPGQGGLTGNSQWFMTTCSGGVAEQQLSTAGEMLPELMPQQDYTIAIERSTTAYTLEITGTFARSGQQTFRFTRPFVVDDKPIWHYNVKPEEYDGRFNGTLVQNGAIADHQWPDQWAQGSAFPDYFVIGDLYTNVYEGNARLDDIKLYVPQAGK